MQSVSSRIWTRVTVSIFNDDNYYTMGTYVCVCVCVWKFVKWCYVFFYLLQM